jgi:hypothetical protein
MASGYAIDMRGGRDSWTVSELSQHSIVAMTVACRMTSAGSTSCDGLCCFVLTLARDHDHVFLAARLVVRLEQAQELGFIAGR